MEKQSPEKYCTLLSASTREYYNSIVSVFCPILQKNVIFNAKGFHHLHYKPDGTPRNIQEIIYKLTLVPLAAPVVKNAVGITDERKVEMRISRKKNAKMIKATQFALTAVVGRKNPVDVRVIVLDIENSPNPIFWSIMKN